MWLVDPQTMCRNHLLGEHLELHMLAGCLRQGKSIKGYIQKGFVDPSLLAKRHAELVAEMQRRGYNHSSPVGELPELLVRGHIDSSTNLRELNRRCAECRQRRLSTGFRKRSE
jgi:hypothetical protein